MLLNLPREDASSSGSELSGSSDDGLLLLALRKILEKEMEMMVIKTLNGLIVPIMEDLTRRVVKQEIQSALETSGNGKRTHETTMSTESRTLQLKFLDGVSGPVLTGKEIEGKGGAAMRLAVVDSTSGEIVNSGPEASEKVEILLLQADADDNEQNWSTEDFNNKIIKDSDKEKPHVAKGMDVRLKEGVVILSDVKLGHGKNWKKRCLCRLGARFVDNSIGSRVKEAWTESFMVEDRRGKMYVNHYPPSLLDEVWRLENIGRDGGPCKDLYKEKVFTVKDFLFLYSIDRQRLQNIFKGSKVWNGIVDHAHTCKIDDRKIYLYSSTKFNYVVVFNVVGKLMGILRNSHYVHLDNLSDDEKACAREMLLLAFENRQDITFVDDEASLVHQYPYDPHDIGVATDFVPSDEYAPIEPDTSSPTIGPSMCPSNNFSLYGSERIHQICDPSSPVPAQAPNSLPIAPGSNQVLGDPSLPAPHQGPNSSLIPLGSSQALCDPSLAVPDHGRSSSLIPLGPNQALCDPFSIVSYQGSNSSPMALGSNQVLCDPSLVVPYQGPSSSLIPPGPNQAFGDTSLIVPDQGPIYSPIDLGLYQALCSQSLNLPDQGLIYSLNDLGSNQALCDPSITVPYQGPIHSLVTLGSYQALCDPFSTVRGQGPNSSLCALGSKHALCDASLSLPEQGPSSSVIALGSYPALCDTSLTVPEQTSSNQLTDQNNLFELFGDNELISLFYHHNKNHSKTCTKARSVQESNAGSILFFAAVVLRMWASRVRKRVTDLHDFDVKRRRIS